ncbi:MAG TPA: hypothetical protein VK048_02375 [Atopostipes sp.]|nr:hypothetical protein [Atopostipes sp.]
MAKKKKHPAFVVSLGFLLTFLFSNVILFIYGLFDWLRKKRE